MLGLAYVKSAQAAARVGSLLGCLLLTAIPAAAAQRPMHPPLVGVTTGRLQGEWTANGGATFHGIPFARPPVGPLRWLPPLPMPAWKGTREALQSAPTCLQAFVGWNRKDAERSDEDCLYLDIHSPLLDRQAHLPVLVWIHGGANWGGSGGWVADSGFADRGVVVVSVQYRLGVFGFLSHPQLSRESPHGVSGNFGLMDQIAALEWVQKNIAAFGGDPAAVTIGGDSAGGQDVGLLLLSPRAHGLFARAIQESGTAGFGLPPRSLAENEKVGEAFAALAGVPRGGAQIDALRAMEGRRLLDAQMLLEPPTLTDYSFVFLQAVVDGWIIPAAPGDLLKEGKSARVPLLIGNTAQEFSLYGGDSAARHGVLRAFGPAANQALELYGLKDGSQPPDDPILGATTMQIAADATFRCPAEFTAVAHTASGQPVWRFQMERAAPDAPRIDHGAELHFIFDDLPLDPATDGDHPVLQSYWVNFIRTGDPNGAGLPQWPRYGADRAYLAFTRTGPEGRTALRASICALLQRP
jgi:para-nitrobenzyl esterase